MTDFRPIYLDYHATTPCDPRVVETMLPYMLDEFGNPSNGFHLFGRRAARAVEEARERIAQLIGSAPEDIVFTSGATESNNAVLFGIANSRRFGRRRIVTSRVEHKSILEPCRVLAQRGFEIILLPVDSFGVVDLAVARDAINDETLLVSIQLASNEIGTLQPVAELAKLAHEHGALFHTDAAQAVGKVPVDVSSAGIDALSLTAHKLYGPKGIGALYARPSVRQALVPLLYGGGQESNLRSGTLNVPGIVGFGKACELCSLELQDESLRVASLRNLLEQTLLESIPRLRINGAIHNRLPGNSSLTFPDIDAETLLLNLPELALSTGSACTSGAIEPSHVLTAIGLTRQEADATVRVGLGRFTTEQDVVTSADLLVQAWRDLSE